MPSAETVTIPVGRAREAAAYLRSPALGPSHKCQELADLLDPQPRLVDEMAERFGPTTAMEIAHLIRTRAAGLTPPPYDSQRDCWNGGVTDVLEMLR